MLKGGKIPPRRGEIEASQTSQPSQAAFYRGFCDFGAVPEGWLGRFEKVGFASYLPGLGRVGRFGKSRPNKQRANRGRVKRLMFRSILLYPWQGAWKRMVS